MRHLPLLIFFFLLTPVLLFSQSDNAKWTNRKFKTADSVFLISHIMVNGSTDQVIDSNRNLIAFPKLIVGNKLNRAIVTEQKVIGGKTIDSLLSILLAYNPNTIKEQGGCFVPRQSIILIKNYKASYIDICFHCHSYETSKDLENLPAIDFDQWKRLENFFRKEGLTYKLDNEL